MLMHGTNMKIGEKSFATLKLYHVFYQNIVIVFQYNPTIRWHEFKNAVLRETELSHSQPFSKSHFYFFLGINRRVFKIISCTLIAFTSVLEVQGQPCRSSLGISVWPL